MTRAVPVSESVKTTPKSGRQDLDRFHLKSNWGTNFPRAVELSVAKTSVSRVSLPIPAYSVCLRLTPVDVLKSPRVPERCP